MGTDMLNAVGGIQTHSTVDAVADILLGQSLFPQCPCLDALKQGAGHIPLGLTGSQAGVQMDMGFDEGRQGQLAAEVHHFFPGTGLQIRGDFFELAVSDANITGGRSIFNIQIAIEHLLLLTSFC